MSASTILLVILGLFALWFGFVFIKDFMEHKDKLEKDRSWVKTGIIGFVVNFFDTLGIGSFAPSTALLRAFKQVDDRLLPGVLNVGCCIPVIVEAFLFIKKVEVEPVTLVGMLAAATVGSYVGAGIMSKVPKKKVQFIMGIALIVTAGIFLSQKLGVFPKGGGEALGLSGTKLIIGIIANFILGALMTAGIGLYAPCMALVYLLGLSPAVAFPIMMGSCAFLMPVASVKFIKEDAYERIPSMAFTIFGVLGVIVAFKFFSELSISALLWLVIVVVGYTGVTLLMAANKKEA
ncbi:MAG: sulfite exporter TauE/SafE family protein [Filifactoraceae bacterium]